MWFEDLNAFVTFTVREGNQQQLACVSSVKNFKDIYLLCQASLQDPNRTVSPCNSNSCYLLSAKLKASFS